MLVLAFGSPRLDIRGVTTVGGNVPGALTFRNARIVREICGRDDVRVVAGCNRPMVRPPVGASEFHGATGLGDYPAFEPRAKPDAGHAVNFIVDTLRASDAPVTLLVTGPLTNVAMALRLVPDIAERIHEIAVMGGARLEGGNITATAEYNIYADPHAAHIVFEAGRPIVLFGLDATHQVRATQARIAALQAIGTRSSDLVARLLQFSARVEREIVGWEAPPLHDPCPLAWLLQPELFELKSAHAAVELASPLTLGATAIEFRESYGLPLNVRWALRSDAQGVFDLIGEAAARLP